ncbi:ubiquilin-4 [Drosophila mojavensis]|uniref:Ubiquitin-like domain-containing protein n=1 Tax=Drosophila mojavensis TaxID=7230 RepID=B4KAB1_DROMO|nr:ubiquilin-4 [Drosophila mojavensis]EDW14598.1 uncharacterized protein Dmoj_GI24345 [Drosophila mojavensis]
MCCKSIDITAKTGSGSALISVRQNELISNLRALVAVRFEQAIDYVVLVFGGHVLRDVGTIDSHGIISGVTVHVIFRQLIKEPSDEHDDSNANGNDNEKNNAADTSSSANNRNWISRANDLLKPLLEDINLLRDLLQADPRIKALIDENTTFRHFMSSDRNLRDLFSTIFNPAKVQELGRKRDLHIMRMEWVPGGYSLMNKLSRFLRQAHEDNVAMNYLEAEPSICSDYPQRGRENRMPLPNPWRVEPKPEPIPTNTTDNEEYTVADLARQCERMMESLKLGDINKTIELARQLNEMADSAQIELNPRMRLNTAKQGEPQAAPAAVAVATPTRATPARATAASAAPSAAASINLFDFMSSNDSRWEQRYQSQLRHLSTLGHTDRQRNICALLMSAGNIQTAVKLLEQWNR